MYVSHNNNMNIVLTAAEVRWDVNMLVVGTIVGLEFW
jgi:hypothetical protein